MLRFKVLPMQMLKEKGWTNKSLLEGKKFGNATMQKFRKQEMVSAHELDVLCGLLDCQPGDLLEYVPDLETEKSPC